MKPTFSGEMQLAGWSESHNGGCKVTFWLSDPDDLEAFRAMTVRKGNTAGQRLMAALVEIGDDEQPVQEPDKPKGGPLSKEAALLCHNPAFRHWLSDCGHPAIDELRAASSIRSICQVESRADFDTQKQMGDRFIRKIRIPFFLWNRERRMALEAA
jgi:hypothetical protein